ncbi:MAG: peptide deformylase [Thermoflexales bacterium]|nr:peptide deformylase [Thermoflexales bacterium]
MRIAISADDGRGLDSVVSPHFGRCPYFILVDVEERQAKRVQAVANPHYGNHQEGQVPAFIHEQGADVMLAGGMGRRAIAFFEQYNIRAVTGAYGTVKQSLEYYLGGQLITIEGEGLLARALQHEVDHLDGILFIARVEDPGCIWEASELKAAAQKELVQI